MSASPPCPNPRRVAAGKLNRRKRGPLSPEGRERLRQAALANRPWLASTGPRTPEGKARAARNGKARQKGEQSVEAGSLQGKAEADLAARIDARNLDPAVLTAAYLLSPDEVEVAA